MAGMPSSAAHEIGDAAAADRADVDDHVKDGEAEGGAQAGGLLHRAGDAGLDDRAAQADEHDAQQHRDGVVGRPRLPGRPDVCTLPMTR